MKAETVKRIIALVIVFSVLLVTCFCETVLAAEEAGETSNWQVQHYVDDFGDETNKIYLSTAVIGDFSNTATKSSDLIVKMGIDYEDSVNPFVRFSLYEYGDTPAVYYEDDDIEMRIKIGEEVYYEDLEGYAPNGDLYCYNIRKGVSRDGSELFTAMIDELLLGNDVRCIINIGNSQYNFTISGNGFRKAVDEMIVEKAEIGNSPYYDYTFFDYTIGLKDGYYIDTNVEEFNYVVETNCYDIRITEDGEVEYLYWMIEDVITTLEDGTQQVTNYLNGTSKELMLNLIEQYKQYLENELGYDNQMPEEGKGIYNLGNETMKKQ